MVGETSNSRLKCFEIVGGRRESWEFWGLAYENGLGFVVFGGRFEGGFGGRFEGALGLV